MPGFVVTVSSVVMCMHGGQAKPTVPSPRVKIMGAPVTTMGPPWVIAGCAFPPPPAANGPCATASFVTSALRVTSMGLPLLLQDSQAVSVISGTGLIIAFANARVQAQ